MFPRDEREGRSATALWPNSRSVGAARHASRRLPTGLGAEVGSMELLLAGAASAAIGFVLHALPRGEALEANAQLLAAAREGKVSTITSLVDSGLAVDAPGEHGETALMVAAGAGKSAAVELLLSIGASMTLVATEDVPGTPGLVAGGTCVHAAAAAAGGELILDTLLTRNAAAVRVCDAQHNTPLHAAAAAGRASAVQACLARDPEPGPEPDPGPSPSPNPKLTS